MQAETKKLSMMNRNECIGLIQSKSDVLKNEYGIISLRLFGSVSRNEQNGTSDVDVFVETQTPNPFILIAAKDYLTQLVGCPVDIIRSHRNLNPRLKKRIERDGVTVF